MHPPRRAPLDRPGCHVPRPVVLDLRPAPLEAGRAPGPPPPYRPGGGPVRVRAPMPANLAAGALSGSQRPRGARIRPPRAVAGTRESDHAPRRHELELVPPFRPSPFRPRPRSVATPPTTSRCQEERKQLFSADSFRPRTAAFRDSFAGPFRIRLEVPPTSSSRSSSRAERARRTPRRPRPNTGVRRRSVAALEAPVEDRRNARGRGAPPPLGSPVPSGLDLDLGAQTRPALEPWPRRRGGTARGPHAPTPSCRY